MARIRKIAANSQIIMHSIGTMYFNERDVAFSKYRSNYCNSNHSKDIWNWVEETEYNQKQKI